MYRIGLDSDTGESFGAYSIGNDDEIIKYITTANVACDQHGEDPMVVDRVVKKVAERKVAVGVHPGYPDLMGFGRRRMVLKPSEVKNCIKYQVGTLMALAASYGMRLRRVVPHSALGNLYRYGRDVSRVIYEAVYEIDPSIRVFYCAGAVLGDEVEKIGLGALSEIFVDRAYMDDLSLVPRGMDGAIITDRGEAIRRCVKMIKEERVTSVSGEELGVRGDTLYVHGDGVKALVFVGRIRDAFGAEGIQISNFMGGKS